MDLKHKMLVQNAPDLYPMNYENVVVTGMDLCTNQAELYHMVMVMH